MIKVRFTLIIKCKVYNKQTEFIPVHSHVDLSQAVAGSECLEAKFQTAGKIGF